MFWNSSWPCSKSVWMTVATGVLVALCAVPAVSAGACPPHDDLVEFLPGYDAELPGCWYSGYLVHHSVGHIIHTHYTLVTAEFDQNDEKPLIYWSNGGPGASSLFGLLTELGPLLLNDVSLQTQSYFQSGIPTPLYNERSWTRLGTILTIDQPAPVGFSYCDDELPDSHTCGGLQWTDELAAQASYGALLEFYRTFPHYQTKDLYLTGESYAGIYIPTLAREIVRHNENGSYNDDNNDEEDGIALKGFAVGDGCLGTTTGICGVLDPDDPDEVDPWNVLFLAGHGQIPMSTVRELRAACKKVRDILETELSWFGGGAVNDGHGDYVVSGESQATMTCREVVAKMNEQAGGVYAYGLYDECTYSNGLQKTSKNMNYPSLRGALNDYPCGGDIVMTDYLNLPEVRKALHVKSDFFSVDNAEGDFDYTPTEPDLSGFYKEMNGKLRVLVYNGDTDPAINSFAAQNWTSHLGFQESEPWRPWTVDGCRRMGGYVTRYNGGFDFLTIRGAGHMVPAIKADAAFTFIKAWLEGQDYPAYIKDCESPDSVVQTKRYKT